MPSFSYTSTSTAGETKKGSIDANDRGEAVRKLARMGLRASALRPLGNVAAAPAKKPAAGSKAKEKASTPMFGGLMDKLKSKTDNGRIHLNHAQVIAFTIELSNLPAAGFPIDQALGAMEHSSEATTPNMAMLLPDLVRDGIPLSSAPPQSCA